MTGWKLLWLEGVRNPRRPMPSGTLLWANLKYISIFAFYVIKYVPVLISDRITRNSCRATQALNLKNKLITAQSGTPCGI